MSRSNESEASETPDAVLMDLVRRLADRGFYVLGLLPSSAPERRVAARARVTSALRHAFERMT